MLSLIGEATLLALVIILFKRQLDTKDERISQLKEENERLAGERSPTVLEEHARLIEDSNQAIKKMAQDRDRAQANYDELVERVNGELGQLGGQDPPDGVKKLRLAFAEFMTQSAHAYKLVVQLNLINKKATAGLSQGEEVSAVTVLEGVTSAIGEFFEIVDKSNERVAELFGIDPPRI